MKNKFRDLVIPILVLLVVIVGCIEILKSVFFPWLIFSGTVMPTEVVANTDKEYCAEIKNSGTANAGRFDVCLIDNGNIVLKKTINGLKKGKSVEVSFYYKFPTVGTHSIDLVIDCKKKEHNIDTKRTNQVEVVPSPITTTIFKKKLGENWYGSQFSGSVPVVYDGKLYVGGKNQYFFCLNKDTGGEIWRYKVADAGLFPGIYPTPVFYKGNVYFGTTGSNLIESGGHVYALNAKDGSLVWKYDTDSDVHSISLDDDKIYAYTESTYVIDAMTGKLIKKYSGTVIANNGKLYTVDHTNGTLSRIDPTTGKVLWNFKLDQEIVSTPVFYNGKIYIDGKHCIDEESGTLVWENKEIGGVHQTFDRDLLFVGGEEFHCVDANSGQIKWEKAIGTISPPVAINGKVYVAPYVGEYEKKVYCLDESTSNIIAIYEVGDVITTPPFVYEGKIYVVAEDGYLYCFKEE